MAIRIRDRGTIHPLDTERIYDSYDYWASSQTRKSLGAHIHLAVQGHTVDIWLEDEKAPRRKWHIAA